MNEEEQNKEYSGLLGKALFSRALQKAHEEYIKSADLYRQMGFPQMASNLDKESRKAQINSFLMEPSPLLTDDENEKYLDLLNKRFSVNEKGDIEEMDIPEEEKKKLEELSVKGFPHFYPKEDKP